MAVFKYNFCFLDLRPPLLGSRKDLGASQTGTLTPVVRIHQIHFSTGSIAASLHLYNPYHSPFGSFGSWIFDVLRLCSRGWWVQLVLMQCSPPSFSWAATFPAATVQIPYGGRTWLQRGPNVWGQVAAGARAAPSWVDQGGGHLRVQLHNWLLDSVELIMVNRCLQ